MFFLEKGNSEIRFQMCSDEFFLETCSGSRLLLQCEKQAAVTTVPCGAKSCCQTAGYGGVRACMPSDKLLVLGLYTRRLFLNQQVAGIVGRADVLSCIFFLISIIFYVG